jgi:hypothetical protein
VSVLERRVVCGSRHAARRVWSDVRRRGRSFVRRAICFLACMLGAPLPAESLEAECIAGAENGDGQLGQAPGACISQPSCMAIVGACGTTAAVTGLWPREPAAAAQESAKISPPPADPAAVSLPAAEMAGLSSAGVTGVPAAACIARLDVHGGVAVCGGWRGRGRERARQCAARLLTMCDGGGGSAEEEYSAAWSELPPMRTARSGCRAVWCGQPQHGGFLDISDGVGRLFVMGGHGGQRTDRQYALRSVEALALPALWPGALAMVARASEDATQDQLEEEAAVGAVGGSVEAARLDSAVSSSLFDKVVLQASFLTGVAVRSHSDSGGGDQTVVSIVQPIDATKQAAAGAEGSPPGDTASDGSGDFHVLLDVRAKNGSSQRLSNMSLEVTLDAPAATSTAQQQPQRRVAAHATLPLDGFSLEGAGASAEWASSRPPGAPRFARVGTVAVVVHRGWLEREVPDVTGVGTSPYTEWQLRLRLRQDFADSSRGEGGDASGAIRLSGIRVDGLRMVTPESTPNPPPLPALYGNEQLNSSTGPGGSSSQYSAFVHPQPQSWSKAPRNVAAAVQDSHLAADAASAATSAEMLCPVSVRIAQPYPRAANTVADGWQPMPPMRYPRAHFAAAALPDGRVVVAGGCGSGGERLSSGTCCAGVCQSLTLVRVVGATARTPIRLRFACACRHQPRCSCLVMGSTRRGAGNRCPIYPCQSRAAPCVRYHTSQRAATDRGWC